MSIQINLNQLRAFYAAARYKSMAAAAKNLYVSPPAITMQIRKLEEWLGFELFHRTRTHLILTEQGEQLYTLAEAVFVQVENLEIHVEEIMQRREGELLFGTHHIPAQHFIPEILAHTRATVPDLKVRMVLGTQEESLEKLLLQKLHLALIIGDPPCPQVKAVPLFDEELVLVVDPAGPLGEKETIYARELAQIPLILQQKGSGVQVVVREFLKGHGVTPHIFMENISSDVIKQFLLQEKSASFIVRFLIQKELEEGTLHEIRVLEGGPIIRFNLAFLAQDYLPLVLQKFLDSLASFHFQQFTAYSL